MLLPDNAIVVLLWVSWLVLSVTGLLTRVDGFVGAAAASGMGPTPMSATSPATKSAGARNPMLDLNWTHPRILHPETKGTPTANRREEHRPRRCTARHPAPHCGEPHSNRARRT